MRGTRKSGRSGITDAEYSVQPKTLFKETGEGRTRFRWIGHCGRREFVAGNRKGLCKQAKRIFFLCFWLHAEYSVQPKTLFKEMGKGRTRFRWIGHCGRREFVEGNRKGLCKQVKRIFFLCFWLHAEYGVQPKTLFQETNEGHTQIRQVGHYGRRVRRASKNTFPGDG